MFFFKRSKIVADFITSRPEVFDHCKPVKGTAALPDWFKNHRSDKVDPFDPKKTIRSCPAITSVLTKTIYTPLWSDLAVSATRAEQGATHFKYAFSDQVSACELHDENSRFNVKPGFLNLKVINPWYLKSKAQFMLTEPVWHAAYPNGVSTITGVLDASRIHDLHQHLFFRVSPVVGEQVDYLLPFKTPLQGITPLTEKKVDIRFHLVDQKELEDLNMRAFYTCSFHRSFSKLRKTRAKSVKSKG